MGDFLLSPIFMVDYCTILLNPVTKSDILAACIQADAAIRAAHEQANATKFAGWLTLSAASFAVVGGIAAYWAASRQVRLTERQHDLLTRAYRLYLANQISQVETEIRMSLGIFKSQPVGYALTFRHREYLPATHLLLNRLSPENWHDLVRAGDLFRDVDLVILHLHSLFSIWQTLLDLFEASDHKHTKLESGSFVVQAIIKEMEAATGRALRALEFLRGKVQEKSPRRWRQLLTRIRGIVGAGPKTPGDGLVGGEWSSQLLFVRDPEHWQASKATGADQSSFRETPQP